MQPAEGIGAPASAAGIVGIVGSVGMAGAPLAAAMPLPAAAIGGGPPLPDDPALGEGGVIVPAEPLALLPAVAVGEAEAGAPAVAVPVVPPEVVGGVVPVGVVASGDVVAGFGFAASLLHAVHASASPRSAATSGRARGRSRSPASCVTVPATRAASRESKCITLLLDDCASDLSSV